MPERSLDELLEINGVVAAGEFGPDGAVVNFKSGLELVGSARDLAARLSAKVKRHSSNSPGPTLR